MKKSFLVVAAVVGLVVIGSVAVWKTSGDDSRRQGALGSDEPVTLSWHGDWSSETEYAQGSVVTYDGASYVAEGEGEKLDIPKPECVDCGWIALEGGSTETKEAAPAVPAVRSYEVANRDLDVPAGASGVGYTVSCPAGKMPLGGGGRAVPPARMIGMSPGAIRSEADGKHTGSWMVWFENPVGEARAASLYAVCATTS